MSVSDISSSETIYAVSTGAGKAAIAVIRVSGPQTETVLERLCGRRGFIERRASLSSIFDADGKLLDRGLVIRFEAPRSFTGEPMIELHMTGGRAIVRGVLEALSLVPGTRPAEAGEFAERAFKNEKLDLTEVEGLASVVEAETRLQLRHALVLAAGALGKRCEDARGALLDALATVESMLDFSDVEDADEFGTDAILPGIRRTILDLGSLLDNSVVSERLRDGMSVVIAGPPNVGKSTLLNCLAKRDVAIVSSFAGTTRDSLEVALEVSGFPVNFTDTAGIRAALDPVEAEGISRSRRKAETADLGLWLNDADDSSDLAMFSNCPVLKVRSKADLETSRVDGSTEIAISAKTGEGIEKLLSRIKDFAEVHFAGAGNVVVASERQRVAVREVLDALSSIVTDPRRPPEIVAEDLRRAVESLGRVTGRVGVEEVLGEIFSRLCVGK